MEGPWGRQRDLLGEIPRGLLGVREQLRKACVERIGIRGCREPTTSVGPDRGWAPRHPRQALRARPPSARFLAGSARGVLWGRGEGVGGDHPSSCLHQSATLQLPVALLQFRVGLGGGRIL